ncbi:trans-1,2-dihydrobenzene-1,2-diol dehydrogenase isoform X2 [Octopus vulgaris]|uniref:Trans-1,2-dihydrobenzene-1,2-diol dehydrogenase n=1 Tax=Octopus vulgaris TaxID=6645 RepID=A0AA36BE83_OCTVU|nr:trans-1,2-dihydrobenzene-1,2-diol dehydrogenase isoform X2 [Octopus vulgaris]
MIATDFCNALQCLNPSEHKITAVVSKSLEKAKKLADEFKIPNVYTSYEEFAKDPNIDLVYLSTVNIFHHPLSILMLNNGKPVLCEKTCACNTKQTEEMTELAKSKKLFFMEPSCEILLSATPGEQLLWKLGSRSDHKSLQ